MNTDLATLDLFTPEENAQHAARQSLTLDQQALLRQLAEYRELALELRRRGRALGVDVCEPSQQDQRLWHRLVDAHAAALDMIAALRVRAHAAGIPANLISSGVLAA